MNIAAELRAIADRAELEAAELERLWAQYPPAPGSAADAAPGLARARAAAWRIQADHVEAGTWLEHLHELGRCLDGYCTYPPPHRRPHLFGAGPRTRN